MRIIQKREGETPLQALERFRFDEGISKDIPLTYAGRLDPMASGALLILIGEECKEKDAHLGYDKEYSFEILFGVSSDTGDILGMPERRGASIVDEAGVVAALESLVGTHTLPYPRFSSPVLKRGDAFEKVLSGTLPEEELPLREMQVREIACSGMRTLTGEALCEDISRRINVFSPPVTGKRGDDFRKPEILAAWKDALREERVFSIAVCTARVSSGTYIRTLASRTAEMLGTSGIAYTIHRSAICGLA